MWVSKKKYNHVLKEWGKVSEELVKFINENIQLKKQNEEYFQRAHNAILRNEVRKDKNGHYRDKSGKFASPVQKEIKLPKTENTMTNKLNFGAMNIFEE